MRFGTVPLAFAVLSTIVLIGVGVLLSIGRRWKFEVRALVVLTVICGAGGVFIAGVQMISIMAS
ncbi:hypothetical protein QDR37_09450 [Amnibacterium sp. CER49]|uniref:hypothetical protein n=1 Tax=Amnibacterium sp. CER49 TaxID=3039161 RepID=UPI00244BE2D8|nr:hypothetical protein [Amnibacterium sp. CER49]MDH2444169.1 hypothetical protein [Amnibacterium sp. CER49]